MHRLPLLACALVAACAASPPAPRPPLELAPFLALRESHFLGAPGVLAGFAPSDDDPSMRVGDAALLGLELHHDGTIERQLVLLEVENLMWKPAEATVTVGGVTKPATEPVYYRPTQGFTITTTSPPPKGDPDGDPKVQTRTHSVHPLQVRLQRLDAAGKPLRTSSVTLFEEPLATGWWPYTEAAPSPHDFDMAFALTMSLQELAGRDPVLQELLFRVVDEPSLWSVATHLGVNVVLSWDTETHPPRPVAIELPPALGTEARSSTMELKVNGDTASWVTLLVTKPTGASRACGGLVGAIAQHPTDAKRIAVVRLLATRRGKRP